MFNKNKKYILDGGSGQTLLEKGLIPEGTLWSATALINKNLHHLVVDMHMDFIKAGAEIIVTSNFSVRKKGAIRGPVAPIKTVHNPLRAPTPKKLGCSASTL